MNGLDELREAAEAVDGEVVDVEVFDDTETEDITETLSLLETNCQLLEALRDPLINRRITQYMHNEIERVVEETRTYLENWEFSKIDYKDEV